MAVHFIDHCCDGIRQLRPYEAGKPIAEIEREYGLSGVIKLASNENPLGPSPKALAAMRAGEDTTAGATGAAGGTGGGVTAVAAGVTAGVMTGGGNAGGE